MISALLPTPRASANENRQTKRSPSQIAGKHGLSLAAEACALLPTPSTGASLTGHGRRGGPVGNGRQSGASLDALGTDPKLWGRYTAAIARWAHIIGRPAPEPTEPGRNGPRLAAVFVEWLLGLDEGWVTAVPGLTRDDQLRLLGNGIVPQQGAEAIRRLAVIR